MKQMDSHYQPLPESPPSDKFFSVRGWDIENFHPTHIYSMLDKAAAMNANTIGFSHEVCMMVEEIIYDWHRYKQLKSYCDYAHQRGMQVFLWTHEVNGPIDKWIIPDETVPKKSRLNMEDTELYKFITEKYRKAINRVPNCDGFILSLTESMFQVQRDYEVVSSMDKSERMAKIINAVYEGCAEFDKILIVRDFLRSPEEMEAFLKAMTMVPDEVWVYTKCVPNDWEFCYPPHPLLGKVAPHKQIMELDLATECGGVGDMTMCIVDYVKKQYLLAREKGLAGAIARCDDGFTTNLGIANEINVWAYGQLLNNPEMDTDILWREWCKARYGKGAEVAEYVLRKTFDITTKVAYTLGFWTGSRAPSLDYTDGHLIRNSNALWDDREETKRIEQGLLYPDKEWIERVVSEKEEARIMAEDCIKYLDLNGKMMAAQDYKDLRENFERCMERAETDRLWAKAYFTFRMFRNNQEDKKALQELYKVLEECNQFVIEAPKRKWSKPDRLREFIQEVKEQIEKMKE